MEQVLEFSDTNGLQRVLGSGTRRVKMIGQTLGTDVRWKGNQLFVAGGEEAAKVLESTMKQLIRLSKIQPLTSEDLVRALGVIGQDASIDLVQIFGEVVLPVQGGRSITPKGLAQKRYVDAVRENDIVFGIGPAGTGKTYLAMAMAVSALENGEVKRIVLTRPAVEAGERLGYLPGDLQEKVNPYLRPLYDALHDMMDLKRAHRLLDEGVIEVAPLAFMRGRTLNDSFVIMDEAQNTSHEQMKMLLTRLGFGSKAIVTGDVTQSDLPNPDSSGLVHASRILRNIRGIAFCEFTEHDVVRHPLVQRIIVAYDRASH